tara:strand:+ start:352 stop:555 length:204 start_codon:yes stop_codon:yes gene_type:complete
MGNRHRYPHCLVKKHTNDRIDMILHNWNKDSVSQTYALDMIQTMIDELEEVKKQLSDSIHKNLEVKN